MIDATLRPRSASELVDASVRLFRQNFGSYVLIAAVAAIPGLVANVIALAAADWGADLQALARQDPFAGQRLGITLLSLAMYLVAEGLYVRLTADAYEGGQPMLGDVVRRVAPRVPAVLVGQLLRFVAVGLGLVALVVPGVVVLVRYAVAAQATVLEETGPIAGLSRSWSLTKGNVLRVLGGVGLAWLLLFIVLLGLQMLGAMLGLILGGRTAVLAVMLVLNAIGGVLIYPLVPIVSTLMYYDLRIRREGLDLELMADDLAAAAPARP
jgi:hypothetical protein